MRLTLRTLLAYLDDVLEPSQTKEIGQKIQESPVAAALVSRVREVIRRRRLGAPDIQGGRDGIDPNIVAQYLDNTLPDDRVADIERVCLESDVHLAEVAACHQILTLVLGEPAGLPQARLDRFYALGPVTADAQLQIPADTAQPVAATPAPVMGGPRRGFEESLPDYLKPNPWPQRYAPVAGIAIVVLGAVLALALDRDLGKTLMGLRQANGTATNGAEVAVVAPPARPDSLTKPAAPTVPAADGAKVAAQGPDLPALPADIDPAPPADEPEMQAPANPPAVAAAEPISALPAAPLPAVAAVDPMPNPQPMPVIPMPDGDEPPKAPIVVPMQYTSTEGIVIRYQRADAHWYVEPRRAELHPEEILATPEPYEGVFDFDGGLLQTTLLGDTVVEILPATDTRRIRLSLQRGRLMLARGPGAPADQPVSLELLMGETPWTIELAAGDSRGAVERQYVLPAGLPFPAPQDASRLLLYGVAGQLQVSAAEQPARQVPAGEVVWLNRPAQEANVVVNPAPSWLDPVQRNASATLRRYGMLFEREFDPKVAVDLSIPALAKDPRPKIAELAVRCLGTTGSYQELVAALVRSEHPEARAAAAAGLRLWLIQDEVRAKLLDEELRLHYPGDESLPVQRLLVGYSRQQAADPLTSRLMVDWLRSNFVEVRELAIDQLERLAGRRYDYRPLASPSQREPAIQRWLGHIEREGAIVKPMAE